MIRELGRRLPGRVSALYLGSPEGHSRFDYASRAALPPSGTRAILRRGLAAFERALAASDSLPRRLLGATYRILQALWGALRVLPASARAWRGEVVLCDRHPLEQLIVGEPASPALVTSERIVLTRILPWPDVVVVLDAPAEVLFARKGEHSAATLEAWRQRYRDVLVPRGGVVVSTDAPVEVSAAQVEAVIRERIRSPSGP
jgi:hypothetical protein